jgi:hypothetical protein
MNKNNMEMYIYKYLARIQVGKNRSPTIITITKLNNWRTKQYNLRSKWSHHLSVPHNKIALKIFLIYRLVFCVLNFISSLHAHALVKVSYQHIIKLLMFSFVLSIINVNVICCLAPHSIIVEFGWKVYGVDIEDITFIFKYS